MSDTWKLTPIGEFATKSIIPLQLDDDTQYVNLGLRMYAKGVFAREAKLGSAIKADRLFEVRAGQFIYNRMFASGGSFGVVPAELAHGVVSNEFPAYDVNQFKALTAYIELYFAQPHVWAQVESECVGTTKSRLRWKGELFEKHVLNLPSLPEQRRIINLIGALDEAIEAADGASSACTALLGGILDSHVSDVSIPLGDLASVKSGASWGAADGSSLPEEGFRPVLTIVNTRPGGAVDIAERTYVRGLSERAAALTADSLVMIRTNGNRGRIGNIYRTPAEVVGDSISAFQFVIEPNDALLRDYLYWVIQAPARQTAISSAASGSTGLGNIAAGWLKEMNIPWSEPVEREAFIDLCNAAGSAVESAVEYASSLRSTRINLLAALMSGEHEIPSSYDEDLGVVE